MTQCLEFIPTHTQAHSQDSHLPTSHTSRRASHGETSVVLLLPLQPGDDTVVVEAVLALAWELDHPLPHLVVFEADGAAGVHPTLPIQVLCSDSHHIPPPPWAVPAPPSPPPGPRSEGTRLPPD